MMTNVKIFQGAQLPNSKTTAYTVPTGKAAIVSSISLVNATAGAITVNVYVKQGGGSSLRIIPKDHSLAAGAAYYVTLPLALTAGEIIEWDASAATSIDGVITGTELTAQ